MKTFLNYLRIILVIKIGGVWIPNLQNMTLLALWQTISDSFKSMNLMQFFLFFYKTLFIIFAIYFYINFAYEITFEQIDIATAIRLQRAREQEAVAIYRTFSREQHLRFHEFLMKEPTIIKLRKEYDFYHAALYHSTLEFIYAPETKLAERVRELAVEYFSEPKLKGLRQSHALVLIDFFGNCDHHNYAIKAISQEMREKLIHLDVKALKLMRELGDLGYANDSLTIESRENVRKKTRIDPPLGSNIPKDKRGPWWPFS